MPNNELHVVPVDDLRPHLESPKCWCIPVEVFDDPQRASVWVHNSMDRREHTVEKGVVQ